MSLQLFVARSSKPVRKPYSRELRALLRLGAPIVAAQLAHISLGFIDTIMAGNLSTEALGAVAVGRSVYSPIFFFVIGILLVINPIIATYFGSKKFSHIGKTVRQGLWLSLFISVPGFLLIRNMEIVLKWLNVSANLIPITAEYLNAISWSLPAALAYLVLRFFNEGISISKPNMFFSLLAIPMNIVANYTLMYGNWGFPKLGAAGAGWATSLIWWTMLISMILLTKHGNEYKHYKIFEGFEFPEMKTLKDVLRIGLPNGFSVALESAMFAVSAIFISTIGVTAIASHQIAINFASITFMIPLGFSIAISSRVGNKAGQNSYDQVWMVGKIGMFVCLIFMLISAATMLLIPEKIAAMYSSDVTVIHDAAYLLLFAGLFQLSDGLQVSASGALRGLKDTKIPMMINFVAYWVIGFPLGYYLAIVEQFGAKGFWIGWIAGLSFAALVHPIRFYILSHQPE